MLSRLMSNFQPRYLGLIGLVILAWAFMSLFRYDNYGIEEGAAHALLLNWSIVHQIISPVALYGIPDLRAIFFVPLDMYWAGSLAAAKVYTMFTLFGTALMLFRWSERTHSSESSMIATALLLLAPISLMQINSLASGIFLLFCFAVAAWLEQLLIDSDKKLPSWFFLMILITAMAVSMHPMGLAIPIVFALKWWLSNDRMANKRLMIGLAITTAIMLFLRWGWHGLENPADNPFNYLSDIILGSDLLHEPGWGIGVAIADILLVAIGIHLYRKTQDTLSLILICASILGIFHSDHAWALIIWTTALYLGVPLLIELNERIGWRGIVGQRGIVLALSFVIATLSMMNNKHTLIINNQELKSSTDQLISVLEQEASNINVEFMAASQWPARTLLVCRRNVLPLPPATEDLALFRKHTAPLTHFIFDPKQESLQQLAQNAASLSHEIETIALIPSSGVVLKTKHPKE